MSNLGHTEAEKRKPIFLNGLPERTSYCTHELQDRPGEHRFVTVVSHPRYAGGWRRLFCTGGQEYRVRVERRDAVIYSQPGFESLSYACLACAVVFDWDGLPALHQMGYRDVNSFAWICEACAARNIGHVPSRPSDD